MQRSRARAALAAFLPLALALLPGLAAPAARAEPEQSTATVVSIGDGDTLRLRQAGRLLTVRLACIDAPELTQRPWGSLARHYLQERLPLGSVVTLQLKAVDRYGRLVAEVIGELNIGLVMVEDGQAFAYRRYLSGCDAEEYLEAEHRASRRRYGVWQVNGGITRPWDFRHRRRQAGP